VEGFPYLRVNRFSASYRNQPLNPAERAAWLLHLAALDQQTRQVELSSLPKPVLAHLTKPYAPTPLADVLAACSQRLQQADLNDTARFALLRERAVVPPDYQLTKQLLGLYPLTVLPVSYGVSRWQQETRQLFAIPLPQLPVQGELRRFRPPPSAVQEKPPSPVIRDVLGIPRPTSQQLARLFAIYAPVWEIDVAGIFDLPGAPVWRNGVPSVITKQPIVYRYPSYTRWQDRVLLQLNYVIWFSERPRSGPLDILGGALDGIIWRVTLDTHEKPLLYDTIHPCGCYHLLFPTSALHLRSEALQLSEPPLVPQAAPPLTAQTRIVVRLGSGNHYIQRIYADIPSGQRYVWQPYQALYAIPAGNSKQRSLFGPDGLVPGTERGERWLLWPMGIASPGAMREHGRHATAFVGRRHFDDAHLLDRLFEPTHANQRSHPNAI
jgi:hypothetical protein